MRTTASGLHHVGRAPSVATLRRMASPLAVVLLIAPSVGAQVPIAPGSREARYMRDLGPLLEGPAAVSQGTRDRILGDSAQLEFFAALLEGRVVATRTWHVVTALWFLAESNDPRHVKIFLRYAAKADADSASEHPGLMALYGLARHASDPEAQAALWTAMRDSSPQYRAWLHTFLGLVNDSGARALLRASDREGLPTHTRALVDSVLASPPLPSGEGRFCMESEVFSSRPGEPYRCRPADRVP